jgi:hypothetical protein
MLAKPGIRPEEEPYYWIDRESSLSNYHTLVPLSLNEIVLSTSISKLAITFISHSLLPPVLEK